MNKKIYAACLFFFILAIIDMIFLQSWQFVHFLNGEIGYYGFPISEWMINYEGGFVRRGLIGQLLYEGYCKLHYNVVFVIAIIYYVSLAAFAYLFIKLLIRKGISIFILPFSLCLFYSLGGGFISGRRDYLALLLSGFIFFFYFKSFKCVWKKWLIISVLSVLTLLMHEGSFFFTFPILLFYELISVKHLTLGGAIKTTLKWMPMFIVLILVALNKGTTQIANDIWTSWLPCMNQYPLDGNINIGQGVSFLTWSMPEALNFHFSKVWESPIDIVVNAYMFIAVYYLVTRINTISLGWYKLQRINVQHLSNIVILQFVALLPMFGFLSVDWGRTVPYWVMTSLMLYCFMPADNYNACHNKLILRLSHFSSKCQRFIESHKILKSPIFYLFILISLPLSYCFSNTGGIFYIIPYNLRLSLWLGVRNLLF